MGALVAILMILSFYFLPSIIAAGRKKQNTGAILALNTFLGWTFVGWVVAFIWALTADQTPQIIQVQQNAFVPYGFDPRTAQPIQTRPVDSSYREEQPPTQWSPPRPPTG
jgi:T4 superinfection immunity protein